MEEPEPALKPPQQEPVATSMPSTSAAAVVSTVASNAGFQMNTGATTGIDIDKAISGSKGLGDTSGLTASLTKGMGREGGTSMVRFMGQTAEVQAVVLVVDISGSLIQGKKRRRLTRSSKMRSNESSADSI